MCAQPSISRCTGCNNRSIRRTCCCSDARSLRASRAGLTLRNSRQVQATMRRETILTTQCCHRIKDDSPGPLATPLSARMNMDSTVWTGRQKHTDVGRSPAVTHTDGSSAWPLGGWRVTAASRSATLKCAALVRQPHKALPATKWLIMYSALSGCVYGTCSSTQPTDCNAAPCTSSQCGSGK